MDFPLGVPTMADKIFGTKPNFPLPPLQCFFFPFLMPLGYSMVFKSLFFYFPLRYRKSKPAKKQLYSTLFVLVSRVLVSKERRYARKTLGGTFLGLM